MEASRVDDLVNRAIDEQITEYREWRAEAAALRARVEALETAVERLTAELSATVERAARAGVAGEIDRLSADVRRQISDLGRLIVNDLGRLPTLLSAGVADAVDDAVDDADGAPDEVDLREPEGDHEAPSTVAAGSRRGLFRRR
jgi:hypothetical protein